MKYSCLTDVRDELLEAWNSYPR